MGADPDEAAAEFRAMTVTRTQLRMLAGLFDAAEISDASKEARTAADRPLQLYGCGREKPWPPTGAGLQRPSGGKPALAQGANAQRRGRRAAVSLQADALEERSAHQPRLN